MVEASDGNGRTTSQTINVTVSPVNDNNPVITSSDTASVPENTSKRSHGNRHGCRPAAANAHLLDRRRCGSIEVCHHRGRCTLVRLAAKLRSADRCERRQCVRRDRAGQRRRPHGPAGHPGHRHECHRAPGRTGGRLQQQRHGRCRRLCAVAQGGPLQNDPTPECNRKITWSGGPTSAKQRSAAVRASRLSKNWRSTWPASQAKR